MISESWESECVSLSRAAKILGVCVRTVRREIERRKLIAFRVGRSLRIRMSELRRYMEEQTMGLHV
jgi:excisionase family DNA binding protein